MKPNKVYCLFEQSGTFKAAFQRRGIWAQDYDIRNDFGQTDHQYDLFDHIRTAYYTNDKTLFDIITPDDLIMAFFPCIYFSQYNQMMFCGTSLYWKNKDREQTLRGIIDRAANRQEFYDLLLKLCYIAETRNLRLIIENPFSVNHYLYNNFPYKPAIVDFDRTQHGDYFTKPTQYFFINCEPTHFKTVDKRHDAIRIEHLSGNRGGGICNAERSLISPEYAENFINDYILGVRTEKTEKTLFDP